MHIFGILFFIFLGSSTSYKIINTRKIINRKIILYDNINNNESKNNKIDGFLQLIRAKNIIPCFFLNFSGGFIMEPSITELFYNKNFIISSVITSLIMSTSMIINDLFDIDIDKINNKNRPLITGAITKKEAIISIFSISSLVEYLNLYLPNDLQNIVNISLFSIFIYTPIIKKIVLVKNIFCAFLVSFSIILSGLSTSNISFIDGTPILNYNLFIVEIGLIFFGSLYNEILLDITDIKGDKINNINTLPVIIGEKNTLIIECIIITFNMISSFLLLLNNYDVKHAILLELCFIPLIYDLYNIIKNDLDDFYIKKAVSNLNITLFLSLIYICSLSII